MNFIETLRISWRNIREHKLRSTLTTIGVIIGVAAVITFVTLGASLQAEIIQTVAGGNAATMYVSAKSTGQQGLPELDSGGQTVFTEHDVEQLRKLEGVAAVVPQGGIAAQAVEYNNDSVARQWITVTSPDYFDVRGQQFIAGRPFQMGEQEVVLNRPAARMFENGNVSVGDQITITRPNREEVNATVVGIVEPSQDGGQSFLGSGGRTPAMYAPTNPYYHRTALSPSEDTYQRVYRQLLVVSENPGTVDAVQGRVFTYLGEQSDAKVLKSRGYEFEVTTHEQLVNQIKQVSSTFTAYITGIALISLIVGSIGIANIMLVSVTERIMEIGIMKAVGAQKRDILELFLIEAVLLGLIGSILGALVGVLGGFVATEIIGLPLTFRAEWFGIAVLVGVLVGIVAGLYPAWDAARIDPIEALRHE